MIRFHFLFRVDSNKQIGTGHFFRCLYLARALRRRGLSSNFLMADADGIIPEILKKTEGYELTKIDHNRMFDAEFLSEYLITQKYKRSLLVIDSPYPPFYAPSFQDEVRKTGSRLMMITFRNEGHFKADIVHNQNLLALEETYSAEPYTRCLLGPEFIILDDRFPVLRTAGRPISRSVEKLFLFFGGADSANLTLRALTALINLKEKPRQVITVVGHIYNRMAELTAFIRNHIELPIELHAGTSEMPVLMAGVDLAITSGGLSVWELACLGTPNIVISASERERIHTPLLQKRGVCLYLGHHEEVSVARITDAMDTIMEDRDRRTAMACAGKDLVDGRGTNRVLDHMINILHDYR